VLLVKLILWKREMEACWFIEYVSDGTLSSYLSMPLQIVPDDNSCLFSAAALIFEQNIANAQEMRKSEHQF